MTLRIYGDLALQNRSALKLLDAANSYSVQLKAPASLSQDTTFALPASLGQNNQVMITDANGQFSFSFISNDNVATNAAIALSKLAAVTVSRALVSDASGVMSASSILATELDQLAGVSGNVQSQLDSEAAARQAADSQEASDRAAADSQEASARQAADAGLASDIASEASAREAADAELAADLASEVSDRQAAVSAEQSAREAADASLASDLADEVSARSSAVSQEASARQTADANLQSQIDNILSNVDPAALDSLSEVVAAFQAADSDLQAAISALGTGANSALGTEIARAEAAEAGLQAAIDSEASTRASAISGVQSSLSQEVADRQSAVSSEASARSSADTALGARIDALSTESLTDVSESGKQDGDLFQWDATEGKWKNVAPLSVASVSTITVPGSESIVSSYTNVQYFNDGAGPALGTTYRPDSNTSISKVGLKIGRSSNLTAGMTVTAKIYSVSESVAQSGTSYSPSNFSLVATSTNTLTGADLALYPSAPEMEYFTFNNVSLTGGAYYIIWAEVDGVSLTSGTNYLAPSYSAGGMGVFAAAHYKHLQNGGVGGLSDLVLGYEIYTGSAGSTSTEAAVGIVKTNADGQLDDSFLAHDVDFGGHKLKGVSTPTDGTDAANKQFVEDQVASEASARSSAVSSEASARQSADSTLQSNIDSEASARANAINNEASTRQAADAAEQAAREAGDQNLQSQIDSLSTGSSAGLSQEISDRQAADSDLQDQIDTEKGRIDAILAASDADKDSFKEIVDLINSVDTENDSAFASYVLSNNAAVAQEVSDRQAADSSEQAAREAADASEASARQAADASLASDLASEASARQSADSALSARLDIVEGSDTTAGSIAKALKDAKAYVDGHKASTDWTMGDTVTLTHNWNTKDVLVQVYDSMTGETITTDVARSLNSVTCTATSSAAMWRVIAFNIGAVVSGGAPTPGGPGGMPGPGPGPGGGGAPGGNSYSFPMVIGVTDNGDGTTNLNWMGASLPNAGMSMVYLVPVVGPAMYDDSAKTGLAMGMAGSANVATPASGTYVLRAYDSTGTIPQATSASFSI